MSTPLPVRTRPSSCLSDLALDRLRVDELAAQDVTQAREHIAQCDRCRDRLAALDAEAAEMVLPALDLSSAAPERTRRRPVRSWSTGLATMAAAAAVAVIVWPTDDAVPEPTARSSDDGPTVRAKGAGPQLSLYVERAGAVVRSDALEYLQPNDILGLSYSLTAPRYLAVLGRDGAGELSTYFPRGTKMAKVDAGRDLTLDVGFQLDDTLGEETVFGVFCEEPRSVAALHRIVQRAPAEPSFGPDCDVVTLSSTKRAPP